LRIKLKKDQLEKMAKKLPFEVIIEKPSDVRGLLEILGTEMPWDETGMGKFTNSTRRPPKVTFSVEASSNNEFVCDIHPALAQHIYDLLSSPE
jgi:hypothetical protein